MTTVTYSSVLDHTTTAAFRVWGAELNTNLAAAGLVQTADTGQINWTTVTLVTNGNIAGYEIWRFADSSIYFKIEFGTGLVLGSAAGPAGIPAFYLTVGTGSNGSGTITGQTSTRRAVFGSGSSPGTPTLTVNSTVTAYTTYICHTADAFAIVWKVNAVQNLYPWMTFVVGKTVDNAGAATSTGFGVLQLTGQNPNNTAYVNGVPTMQSVRTAATAVTGTDTTLGWISFPGNPTSSLAGGNSQIYPAWLNVPDTQPFMFAGGYVQSEITRYSTFSVALVGSTPHTYLALGALGGAPTLNGQSGSTYSMAIIWE